MVYIALITLMDRVALQSIDRYSIIDLPSLEVAQV